MIKIYTDGACSGNPGVGATAFVVVREDDSHEDFVHVLPKTTNNIVELISAINAVAYTIKNNINECRIYSDSKYTVDGINDWMYKWEKNGWRTSSRAVVKNLDLWQSMLRLWREAKSVSNISIHHVKGHGTDKWNVYADKLAVGAVKSYKNDNKQKKVSNNNKGLFDQ